METIKNNDAVETLKKTITKKFKKSIFKRLRSLIAKETPIPHGPIAMQLALHQ